MTRTSAGLAQEAIAPDEAATISEFIAFLEAASLRRHPTGPIRRFNQGRATGCVEAEFTVGGLSSDNSVGLFATPHTYRAYIRFANASSSSDREKDVRGMSISLADVGGENLTAGSSRQDFVLNSHPLMVAPDPKEFLALLRANEEGGLARVLYFVSHPELARIGLAAQQHPSSHLDIPYWSTTPSLFGPGRAVKYIVKPCSERTSRLPSPLTDDYLAAALEAHLAESDACFDFLVQFQTDAARMPIEDATVEWSEQDSPYVPVAKIRVPRQTIDRGPGAVTCEKFAFNPWNCLTEHRPLGGLNRARRDIYRALSAFRAQRS